MILLTVQKDMKNHPFLIEKSSHTPNVVLTTPAQLLCPESDFFLSKYKNTEKPSFFQFFFSLTFLLLTRRLKFQTPCRQLLAKSGTFSLKVRKPVKNHCFSKQNCSKDSSGNAECSNDNPCQIASPRVQFFSLKVQNYQNIIIFSIFFSLTNFLLTRRLEFRKSAVKFWQSPELFRSKYEFHSEIIVFSRKRLKRLLWTRRMHLWQPLPNCFAQSPIL